MTTVTDRLMASDLTPHTARRVQLAPERWRASWLPEKLLDRNQALTAMALAEHLDALRGVALDSFAAELGITGPHALAAILQPPHVLDRRLHVLSTACWCEPVSALEGHRNDDGTEPDFAAVDGDPIDDDGHLVEVLT